MEQERNVPHIENDLLHTSTSKIIRKSSAEHPMVLIVRDRVVSQLYIVVLGLPMKAN